MLENALFSVSFISSFLSMFKLIGGCFGRKINIPVFDNWYIFYPSACYQAYFWFSKYGVL